VRRPNEHARRHHHRPAQRQETRHPLRRWRTLLRADDLLAEFAGRHNIPIVETQSGKGALGWEYEMNYGSPGVTGSACANEVCEDADLVIGVGTRFQDFITGSWTVFANPDRKLISLNLHSYAANKHGAAAVVGDARVKLEMVEAGLGDIRFDAANPKSRRNWHATVAKITAPPPKHGQTSSQLMLR
jgi:3D-(3,5/4)-trihydroxycyclohexane-1,2-dione acylhydrolase (decyclizing)